MNLREKVSDSLTQVKSRIGNWFDRFFPEYASVFKDWGGKTSLMVMRAFPLPADILAKGARDVLTHWKTEVKRGSSDYFIRWGQSNERTARSMLLDPFGKLSCNNWLLKLKKQSPAISLTHK